MTLIKTYVAGEHLRKTGKELDMNLWKCITSPNTPQQNNKNDCGVFVCQIAKALGTGEPIAVDQTQISNLREMMCHEILKGNLV